MRGNDGVGLSRVALRFGLSNADDSVEACGDRRGGGGADLRVGLSMVGAAFAMTDDDQRSPRVEQHRCGHVASVRALNSSVQRLCADPQT